VNIRDALTKQERIVLALVARGWRTARIAEELFISPRTVETHLAHIFEKLGVSSRTEAAIYAIRTNMIMGVEIRTNPDDMLDGNPYAYDSELSDSPRTLIRKELA
jgi:DNA-binding CsgD family transcriptional regulator